MIRHTHCELKPSSIDWIGPIPSAWNLIKVRRAFEIRKRIANTEGYQILSITQRGIKVKDIESNEGQLAQDYSKYQLVFEGDFAMNHMDLLTGYVDIAQVAGVTSPDYRVFCNRDPSQFCSRYYLYVFQLCYLRRIFYALGQGSSHLGRWRLPADQFNNFVLPAPSVGEQQRIVSYLDKETAKLETLIAEQERLIELLREKRRAVISHAVTNGLNPDAPTKESGSDWLGRVPAHWEVAKLKYYVEFLDGRRIPLAAEERGTRRGDFPYYGASGIIDHIDDYIFDEDLILVGEDGANLVNRATPLAFIATGRYWVNNHAHILRPTDGNLRFWCELVEAEDIVPIVSGSAQPKLTIEALANIPVAVPPDEQERTRIAAFIEECSPLFDRPIERARQSIDLMREHRAALISAAVTGKIDIRDAIKTPEACHA